MCERHAFRFDVDKAYAAQVIAALEDSPEHPLSHHQAPKSIGVYALYRKGHRAPVYIGVATGTTGIAGRLGDHLKKVSGRKGITPQEISCRFLVIDQKWEATRAEDAMIKGYKPEWNGIPGFSMHVPGIGRPGKPGYINQWDQRFPPKKS